MTSRDHDPRDPHDILFDDALLEDSEGNKSNGASEGDGGDKLGRRGYPDQRRESAECESCGVTIPPSDSRCPDCADISLHERPSRPYSSESSWQLSRVVVAAVPAPTEEVAIAKATAALTHRRNGASKLPSVSDESVTLIEEFDGAVPATFTSGWGDLPAAVPWESDAGDRLREIIVSKTVWREDVSAFVADALHQSSRADHVSLYTEYGEGVTSRETLDALRADSESLWLVPALAYQPESDARATQRRECLCCGTTTTHEFMGKTPGLPSSGANEEPEWMCAICGLSRSGELPEAETEAVDGAELAGPSSMDLTNQHEQELFERAVEARIGSDGGE